jgi:hypothetical protein
MARRPNYGFEKRQKELQKQQKKDEKQGKRDEEKQEKQRRREELRAAGIDPDIAEMEERIAQEKAEEEAGADPETP